MMSLPCGNLMGRFVRANRPFTTDLQDYGEIKEAFMNLRKWTRFNQTLWSQMKAWLLSCICHSCMRSLAFLKRSHFLLMHGNFRSFWDHFTSSEMSSLKGFLAVKNQFVVGNLIHVVLMGKKSFPFWRKDKIISIHLTPGEEDEWARPRKWVINVPLLLTSINIMRSEEVPFSSSGQDGFLVFLEKLDSGHHYFKEIAQPTSRTGFTGWPGIPFSCSKKPSSGQYGTQRKGWGHFVKKEDDREIG